MLYPTVELFLELRHRVSTRTGRILFGCSSTKAACKSGRYFAGDYHAVSAPVSPGAGVCRRPKECTDSRAHRHSPAASRRDLLNFPMRALVPLGPSCRACLLSASDVCYLPRLTFLRFCNARAPHLQCSVSAVRRFLFSVPCPLPVFSCLFAIHQHSLCMVPRKISVPFGIPIRVRGKKKKARGKLARHGCMCLKRKVSRYILLCGVIPRTTCKYEEHAVISRSLPNQCIAARIQQLL